MEVLLSLRNLNMTGGLRTEKPEPEPTLCQLVQEQLPAKSQRPERAVVYLVQSCWATLEGSELLGVGRDSGQKVIVPNRLAYQEASHKYGSPSHFCESSDASNTQSIVRLHSAEVYLHSQDRISFFAAHMFEWATQVFRTSCPLSAG